MFSACRFKISHEYSNLKYIQFLQKFYLVPLSCHYSHKNQNFAAVKLFLDSVKDTYV